MRHLSKILTILLYILSLIFFSSRVVYAKKSENFLNLATGIIYKDCKNSVLRIPEESFLSAFPFPLISAESEILVPQTWGIKNPSTDDIKLLLQWLDGHLSFPRKILGEVRNGNYLEINDGQEAFHGKIFRTRDAKIYRIKIDGDDLFLCQDRSLSIEGEEWSWNKQAIELPRFQYESLISIKELAFIKVSIGGFEVNVLQIAITGLIGLFGGSFGILQLLHRKKKNIVVASQNPVKMAAVREGFERMFPHGSFETEGIAVSSGVSVQPVSDEETRRGAAQRAAGAAAAAPAADFHVGIEGGIEQKEDGMEAFAWVVIRGPGGKIGTARSAAFFLPPRVAALIKEGKELGEADDIVFGRVNSKQENGAIGLLTGDVIDRKSYYREAIIMALIPFKNEHLYL